METAILWGDSPFAFLARPEMERAIMTAHYRERGLRSALVSKVQSEVADKWAKKDSGKETGPSPHDAFFNGR